ncbi:MAG: hypothetical protein AYK19_19375 [Theionarchaea archaeon DG-70-1]|nr:MAG: hypothetical protein AYK19_19375 [Theionarchaea archaeon DG-70-1]
MIEYEHPKDKRITEVKIRLGTFTPLWTGGIRPNMDRLHETGIIGSLRWWYEAIVRGLGHYACDPTSGKEESPCSTCQLFGCTGLKRKFSLSIKPNGNVGDEDSNLNIRPHGRNRGWFISPGFSGDMTIHLYGKKKEITQIAFLVHWLSQWGSIGAKSQLGYGVFEVLETLPPIEPLTLDLLNVNSGKNQPGGLPDLRAFTFFKFHFVPHSENWWKTIRHYQSLIKDTKKSQILGNLAKKNMVPVSPLLKDYFRFKKEWKSFKITKWLFGTIERGRKEKSRVSFSWAYRVGDHWEVRGWAWLPYWSKSRNLYREAVNGLKNTLGDETDWLKAMDLQGKVSKARVYIEPGESPWGIKDTDTIMKWLKGGIA